MITDNYTITTAATTYPVSLTEVKLWCKITHTIEDALLTSLITAATQKAELVTNRVFISQTYTGEFSGLRCTNYETGYFIQLRRAPVSAVTSVKVYENDVLQTIDSGDYNLKTTVGFPRIVFEEIDYTADDIPYPYQVVFVAGYGAATAVPEVIKIAIKETIAHWYQNRGDCGAGNELPAIAKGLLREYKILNTLG